MGKELKADYRAKVDPASRRRKRLSSRQTRNKNAPLFPIRRKSGTIFSAKALFLIGDGSGGGAGGGFEPPTRGFSIPGHPIPLMPVVAQGFEKTE